MGDNRPVVLPEQSVSRKSAESLRHQGPEQRSLRLPKVLSSIGQTEVYTRLDLA